MWIGGGLTLVEFVDGFHQPVQCVGDGGVLDYKEQVSNQRGKTDFSAWNDAGKVQNRFIDTIMDLNCGAIVTLRSKSEYVQEKDPESAQILHENDVKRVVRALEIFFATGKKKSEQNDKEIPRYSYIAVMIDMDREVLYDRINRRVDIMLENGLVNEVKSHV